MLCTWMKLLSIIFLIKAVTAPYYWVYIPYSIKRYGVKNGFLINLLLQFIVSILIWIAYDMIGRDLIGINAVKAKWDNFVARLRTAMRWNEIVDGIRKIYGRDLKTSFAAHCLFVVLKFSFLSNQLMPWIVNLCFRIDGKPKSTVKEIGIILGSSLFTAAWWTGYSKGVLHLLWPTLKSYFDLFA